MTLAMSIDGTIAPYQKESVLTWHEGSPPHVGWWNASREFNPIIWRWWNGEIWSRDASANDSAEVAEEQAMHPAFHNGGSIKWSNYWPENARVPRVDPRSKS